LSAHFAIQNNLELFKADASTDIWRAYVDYLDDMVLDGFFNCIHCSLNYLLENTDAKHNMTGLFEAKLELQQPEMVFIPSLDFGISDGFYELVEGIVNDVYKMASLVKRLAEHNGSEHYQVKSFHQQLAKTRTISSSHFTPIFLTPPFNVFIDKTE